MTQTQPSLDAHSDTTDTDFKYPATFRGLWIPLPILTHPEFGAVEKILISEILALQKDEGAWASNGHYARLLGVKDRMVRSYVSRLEKEGFIRASKRTSKKRRLWIGDATRVLLEGPSAKPRRDAGENPSAGTRQETAVPPGSQTRHDCVGEPGEKSSNPAGSIRPTRQPVATENTVREQGEYKKNTIGDFSLPDWLPASVWSDWVDYNIESGRKLSPRQMAAQVAELERLHNQGNNFKTVIAHAIENGWKSFFELPASKRSTSYRTTRGVHIMGGRVVY